MKFAEHLGSPVTDTTVLASMFDAVDELSDASEKDSAHVTPARVPLKQPGSSTVKHVKPLLGKRLFTQTLPSSKPQACKALLRSDLISRTRAIVHSKCRCARRSQSRKCFEPFRCPNRFTELVNHLRYLAKMDKMEVDKEALLLKQAHGWNKN